MTKKKKKKKHELIQTGLIRGELNRTQQGGRFCSFEKENFETNSSGLGSFAAGLGPVTKAMFMKFALRVIEKKKKAALQPLCTADKLETFPPPSFFFLA